MGNQPFARQYPVQAPARHEKPPYRLLRQREIYRFYRGEVYLSPDDQAYIRKAFRQYNIPEEPVFDSYSEEYSW